MPSAVVVLLKAWIEPFKDAGTAEVGSVMIQSDHGGPGSGESDGRFPVLSDPDRNGPNGPLVFRRLGRNCFHETVRRRLAATFDELCRGSGTVRIGGAKKTE